MWLIFWILIWPNFNLRRERETNFNYKNIFKFRIFLDNFVKKTFFSARKNFIKNLKEILKNSKCNWHFINVLFDLLYYYVILGVIVYLLELTHLKFITTKCLNEKFPYISGSCEFPSSWTGEWYQYGKAPVTINTTVLGDKACVERTDDKYVVL